jgi:hypothetical protein
MRMSRDPWLEKISNATPVERSAVDRLLACLRAPVDETINPNSDIATPAFAAEFKGRLLTQHLFVGTPLLDLTFERAFRESMATAGFSLGEHQGNTARFWDCQIGGQRFSLKSTQAKSLSPAKATISKLTEAAWIQDCRTAAKRREKTLALFSEYLSSVDRLIQIRYFESTRTYELLEIPMPLFVAIKKVPQTCYRADGPTIGIPVGQIPPDFTLVLDRSDAKVTIRNVLVEKCIVHARWKLPARVSEA